MTVKLQQTHTTSFPGPSPTRPMEQEREEPGDEAANPPSTLLSTSIKLPSFMRELLFCMIPAGKEHCYRNINQWSTLRQKGSFSSYLPTGLFFASAVLLIILMRRKCLKNKATTNTLLSAPLK